jgi:hypothetical protein
MYSFRVSMFTYYFVYIVISLHVFICVSMFIYYLFYIVIPLHVCSCFYVNMLFCLHINLFSCYFVCTYFCLHAALFAYYFVWIMVEEIKLSSEPPDQDSSKLFNIT